MTNYPPSKSCHCYMFFYVVAALMGLLGCCASSLYHYPFSQALAVILYLVVASSVFLLLRKTRRLWDKTKAKEERTLHRLLGINRMQKVLILPVPLEERFKKITQTAVDLLDLEFCCIWMVKPGDLCHEGCIHADAVEGKNLCRSHGKCLHLVSCSGVNARDNHHRRRIPLGCFQIGQIAAGEIKKCLSNHLTGNLRETGYKWAEQYGLESFAGYKLRNVRNETLGVLAMYGKYPFSEDDDALFENLAETTSKVIMVSVAEEELRQVMKLESVGQLAGGIAHEFNNLLQVIGGYTQCALQGLEPYEERYQDLQQVSQAVERATALTRQLLGFSRRQLIQPKNVDANLLIEDLLKVVRPAIGEHILLKSELSDDTGEVFADASELQQVLLNLCFNARDAMPSGGVLTLKTNRAVLTETLAGTQGTLTPGSYVLFSVSDTGCGIPRNIQAQVFEPFFTTKEAGKGTGMGLAVVSSIVQQHQGALQISSEVGKGTTIELYLPSRNGSVARDESKLLLAPSRGKETILIAEDDPLVRKLAVRTLEKAGYEVYQAADGEEAQELFDQHRDKISLVVLDMIMPKRTGPETYRHVKNLSPEVKVVFCTGYDPQTAQAEDPLCKEVPLIEKPYTAQSFLDALRKVLDAPATCLPSPEHDSLLTNETSPLTTIHT
jgi:signal transduction histidine kinase/FixJ family two-component response regulator